MELRLTYGGVRWIFALSPDSCEVDWPEEPLFERYATLFPMQVTPRLAAPFGEEVTPFAFTVAADGALRAADAG